MADEKEDSKSEETVSEEEAFQWYLDRRQDVRYRMMDADWEPDWI